MSLHHHLDPRSALVIDLHDLERRAGTMKRIRRVVPAPADLGIDMIGVPEGSDITLDIMLEAVVEGVLVTGSAEVRLTGECTRCLEPIEDTASYEVQELYFYPGRDAEEDASRIEGDLIDLDPALRDAVVLELPFAPLCREDCAGLCPICGALLNDDPEHHHDAEADSRWNDLARLAGDEGADPLA